MPLPMARAASRKAGSVPNEEPQKTQMAAPDFLISALSMLPTGLRGTAHLFKPGLTKRVRAPRQWRNNAALALDCGGCCPDRHDCGICHIRRREHGTLGDGPTG